MRNQSPKRWFEFVSHPLQRFLELVVEDGGKDY
jgi:hypothetical protein